MKKKKILTYTVTLIGFITIGVLCSIPQFYSAKMEIEAESTAMDFFGNVYEDVELDEMELVDTDLILEKSLKGYTGFADRYEIKYSYVYYDWRCDLTVINQVGYAGDELLSIIDISFYPNFKE